VMGADYQPMGHAHVVSNMVDYGMDVQAAIDAPRMFYEGKVTLVERGIPAAAVAGLKARGIASNGAPLRGAGAKPSSSTGSVES
jgi:gamma-glutamyltranspeptidase/glutathione hydrolase